MVPFTAWSICAFFWQLLHVVRGRRADETNSGACFACRTSAGPSCFPVLRLHFAWQLWLLVLSILDEEYARGPAFREQVQDDFPRRLRLKIASVQAMNIRGKQLVGLLFAMLHHPQVIFLCSTRLRGSYIMQIKLPDSSYSWLRSSLQGLRSLYILIVGPGVWARLAQLHGAYYCTRPSQS